MKPILIAFCAVLALALAYMAFMNYLPTPGGGTSTTTTDAAQSGSNAKINIDAVCEGVLAYMTFPNGAAADAFVAECKEGKHPEVIEQYKAQLNVGAGAAI
jgi:hypothetical protein